MTSFREIVAANNPLIIEEDQQQGCPYMFFKGASRLCDESGQKPCEACWDREYHGELYKWRPVMNKEEIAGMLDGCEYSDIDAKVRQVEAAAKASGLLIVYGESDDLLELRGALSGEYGCYDGGTFCITAAGIVEPQESICERCSLYKSSVENAHQLIVKWCDGDFPWSYEIDVPYATFEIHEDGDKYCQGIVFEQEALL